MDQKHIKKINQAQEFYKNYEYDKALLCIDEVLKEDKHNSYARNCKAMILIDSWNGEESTISKIKEAISHLEIVIKEMPQNNVYNYYNLANAYNTLAIFYFKKNNRELNQIIVDYFETAKDYYQKSLDIDIKQPKAWINKGNIFHNLGRYFDAIECYDRAILINHKHYNAWGNRGLTCWHLSQLVTNKEDSEQLFHHAMIYLAIEKIINPQYQIDEDVKKYIDKYIDIKHISLNFEDFIKEQLPKKLSMHNDYFNLFKSKNGCFRTFYLTFCQNHRLFLNTHFDCINCELTTKDLLEFSFIHNINDKIKPYELKKKLNAILDEYKTARSILVLSQYKHDDFLFLDKQRYEPDYSLNYIHNVELLKYAFLIVMGVYDKVAFFLNDYEQLGQPEREVSFWGDRSTLRYTDKKIIKTNNWDPNLVAMDSIRNDLDKKEFKNMVDIRNYIVHRYFVLHDIINVKNITYPYDDNNTPIISEIYHMDINEFFDLTIKSFQNIHNILFSLSFYISKKERVKEQAYGKPIPIIYETNDFDNNPELQKIADEYAEEMEQLMNKQFVAVLESLLKEYQNKVDSQKSD